MTRARRTTGWLLFLALWPFWALAAPGDVLFEDSFERAALAPWSANVSARAGILTGGAVSNLGTRGLFTRWDPVTVTGPSFNAAVPAAEVQLWVRRGSDAFSELPDGGENLVLEYRRADGTWGTLQTWTGGGTPGEVFNAAAFVPADGLHGNTALRVRQTAGSGSDFDYFHIDDIRVIERAATPQLTVGTCEEFSSGLASNWTVQSLGGSAGTSSATFQSPGNALFTNGGTVTVTSGAIDTATPAFQSVSLWVRRGADAFSENPDGAENFVIEYRDDAGAWVQLESFAGSGTPGQVFLRDYPMPAAARHSNFALRFRQVAGSGSAFDFWHVDDVCLEAQDLPQLRVAKVSSTLSDPLNGTSAPYSIPGAVREYLISVINEGAGTVDGDSLVITDPIDPDVALYVDTSVGDPIVLIDGAVPSGVTLSYRTGVTFSNQPDGGPPFDYTPVPDANGYDSAVRGVRMALSGTMSATGPAGAPSFQLRLLVRIQ